MSEIADELERMAEEFDGWREDAHTDLLQARREQAVHAANMAGVQEVAFEKAAKRLRERAAELRAQRNDSSDDLLSLAPGDHVA